jgi:hypothetical protein
MTDKNANSNTDDGILTPNLIIDKNTKVSDILSEYGDIAAVMETFGVKRVGGFSVRKYLTKALTVERAAKIHRVPLDDFLTTLRTAVGQQT